MAILQNSFRQYTLVAEVLIDYTDFTNATATATPGETQSALNFPANSVITGGFLATRTDVNDDASETFTMDIGRLLPVQIDEYLNGVSVDGDADTVDQLVILGKIQTAAFIMNSSLIASTGSSVLNAGSLSLVAEYITVGRSNDQVG